MKKHGKNIDFISLIDEDSDSYDDDNIQIELESNIIEISYSQLCKYSSFIREKYGINEAKGFLTENLIKYESEYGITEKIIIIFFKSIDKDKNITIDVDNFWSINILSTFLSIKKYQKQLKKFTEDHANDISFISMLFLKQSSPNFSFLFKEFDDDTFEIGFEDLLKENVDECLQNKEFEKLPIPQIYKIVAESDENYTNDILYDFIRKDIEKRCCLFELIELRDLSDEKFDDLYNVYISDKKIPKKCFDHLKINLDYLNEIRKCDIDQLKNENKQLFIRNNELKIQKKQLKEQLENLKDSAIENFKYREEIKIFNQKQVNSLEDEYLALTEEIKQLKEKLNAFKNALPKLKQALKRGKKKLNDMPEIMQKKIDNFTNMTLFLAQNVKDYEKKSSLGIFF